MWRVGLALGLVACTSLARAGDFGLSVGAASDYVVRGLTRSRGSAVVQAQIHYVTDRAWRVGLAATSMDINTGPGPKRELGLSVARVQPLGRDWSLGFDLAYYEFGTRWRGLAYDYGELTTSLRYRERYALAVSYSPDYSLISRLGRANEREVVNISASMAVALRPTLTLNLGVGHFDLEDLYGFGYYYWSASANWQWRNLTVATTLIDSESAVDRLYGPERAGRRFIASAALRLR
jgi:uncharacterized protein (TIGR02001 family)